MKFNEKIYTLRRKKGWSQEELANEVDISRQSVYKLESGESMPDIEKIKKLAKIFNVSLDSLLIDDVELNCEQSSTKKDEATLNSEILDTTSYQNEIATDDKKEAVDRCEEFDATFETKQPASADFGNGDVPDEHTEAAEFNTAEPANETRVAKNVPKLIIEIIQLLVNCITLPFLFIPFFHEVAVLPGITSSGEHVTHRFDHYYSVYDKIAREGLSEFFWIAVVIISTSILFCVLNMSVKNNKILKIIGYIFWISSMVLFFVLLFKACSISYEY
ncbi:MAG: helix-turn-helix transcriptional regulator [Clostridiales bacterium]|nr:helix-turn-helix transcriptional regulator [Clostridiales bacterium]